MAQLESTDFADLVASTLNELGRLRFQQIGQQYVYYEVFQRWFKKDKVAFDDGLGIKRTLLNRIPSEAAAHVGLMDKDNVSMPDVLDTMTVPWRSVQTSWSVHYITDILQNRGRSLIVNVIKPRRAAALIALVEEIEEKAWASPDVNNKTEPYGLPYWVTKSATTGFNGGAASGHTTVAGVSLTDSPTFKNYTYQYASVSKADMIKGLRTAHRSVRFISPIDIDDYRGGIRDRYRLYCNETTISAIEDLGEAQNENLGRDIASMDGRMVFRGHPIVFVPKLDDDSQDPLYMIDHSTFYPICLRGDYLRESEAQRAPEQHNVYQSFIDLTYNYACVDRRRNAVLAKA